jgi:hypothetical protein
MNTELQNEKLVHDIELPAACVACGGPINARFTASGARGVCLACHMFATLGIARVDNGVQVAHVPHGVA